jgi:hypothetical protein
MSRASRRVFIIVLAALAFAGVAAQAAPQYSPQTRVPWGPASPAFDSGHARGVSAGEEDGRRGDPFNFTDESDYRRADAGYRREFGSIDRYRDEFRRGFENGYRTGFLQRGRAGGPGRDGRGPGWNGRGRGWDDRGRGSDRGRGGWDDGYGTRRDLAFNHGFADGFNAGFVDGERRRRFEPTSEGRYKDGDHGYERFYGSRDIYRVNYRDAFLHGYDEGYREAVRRLRW